MTIKKTYFSLQPLKLSIWFLHYWNEENLLHPLAWICSSLRKTWKFDVVICLMFYSILLLKTPAWYLYGWRNGQIPPPPFLSILPLNMGLNAPDLAVVSDKLASNLWQGRGTHQFWFPYKSWLVVHFSLLWNYPIFSAKSQQQLVYIYIVSCVTHCI